MAENCEPCLDEIIPPPAACAPGTGGGGTVTVDLSAICTCIETQTGELCTCIASAADLIVEAINNQPAPPVVIPLACQPCIAVNGAVDGSAMIVIIDGVPTYFNAYGEIDPAAIEILDACDPRCTACDCGETIEECCDCECTETQLTQLTSMYVQAVGV